MRLHLLAHLLAGFLLPSVAWGAQDATLPAIVAEDQFGDIQSELPSDTVPPPPKAPPPTEVTRVLATRDEGEAATAANNTRGGGGSSAIKRSRAALDALVASSSTSSRFSRPSGERTVRLVAMSLFAVAFLGVVVTLLSEFDRRLDKMDAFFPPSMQPQDVPQVVADLIEKNKIVVFVADDCLICMDGLRDLKRQLKKPEFRQLAFLVSGHRHEWTIREFLEKHYNVSRLPVIFIDGEPFSDFASALHSFTARGRNLSWKSGGSGNTLDR